MEIVIIIILAVSTAIQLYFWIFQFGRLARPRHKHEIDIFGLPSLTIIIAAQNERKNIENHLHQWLNQEYPKYELIIVDDHSTDGTKEYLAEQSADNLKVLHLPEELKGKKSALNFGIEESNTDWIITTDADCYPGHKMWLKYMLAPHTKSDVILGYSPVRNKSKTLLSYWTSYETWYIATQYLSAALCGRAYMGVGRNLAYRRSTFASAGGYSKHMDLKSGDDDLFIASLASSVRLEIVTTPEAWVWTNSPLSWNIYIQQKRRHLTTAPRYKVTTRIWLFSIFLSQILFYFSLFFLFPDYPELIVLFLLRALIILSVSFRPNNLYNLMPRYLFAPAMDLFLCFFYLMISPTFLRARKDW